MTECEKIAQNTFADRQNTLTFPLPEQVTAVNGTKLTKGLNADVLLVLSEAVLVSRCSLYPQAPRHLAIHGLRRTKWYRNRKINSANRLRLGLRS